MVPPVCVHAGILKGVSPNCITGRKTVCSSVNKAPLPRSSDEAKRIDHAIQVSRTLGHSSVVDDVLVPIQILYTVVSGLSVKRFDPCDERWKSARKAGIS